VAVGVGGASLHVLLDGDHHRARVERAARALTPGRRLTVLQPRGSALLPVRRLAGDVVPAFVAAVVAVGASTVGAALLGRVLTDRTPSGPGVVSPAAAGTSAVRTVHAAPERTEVLGAVVEVGPGGEPIEGGELVSTP
jgi:hypothetical protein